VWAHFQYCNGPCMTIWRCEAQLVTVHARFAQHFSRSEPRAQSLQYMRGLIAPLERKNGWTLADPHGVPFAWATADEVYGQNRALRASMESRELHHVLATRRDDQVRRCSSTRRTARSRT
jgi:hypothetical protein